MYRKTKLALAICTVLAVSAAAANADDEKDWSLTLDLPFSSAYVWRGINLVDEWVFQPSFAANYKWITASVWGSMELTNENRYDGHGDTSGDFTEIDYTVDLSHSFGKLGLSAGAVLYTFPNTDFDPTTEVYASAGYDCILSPSFSVYYDVDLAHGVYMNFALGHTFEDLWKPSDSLGVSLDLSSAVGFATSEHDEFYYGVEHDGLAFTDVIFSIGLPVAVGKNVTVTPSAHYTMLMDERIRDNSSKDDNFWGGAGISFTY